MRCDLVNMPGSQDDNANFNMEPLTAWLRTSLDAKYRSILVEPVPADLQQLVLDLPHES